MFSYATLSAGTQNGDITLVATIASPIAAGISQIATSAVIKDDGSNHSGGELSVTSNTVTTVLEGSSDISLLYTATAAQANPGDVASYTVTYTNAGDLGLSSVNLVVEVPTNAAFDIVASNALLSGADTWSCDSAVVPVTCTLAGGDIAGGGSTATKSFVLELNTLSTSASAGGSDVVSVRSDLKPSGSTDSLATATATTNIARCAFKWGFETSGQDLSLPTQNPLLSM